MLFSTWRSFWESLNLCLAYAIVDIFTFWRLVFSCNMIESSSVGSKDFHSLLENSFSYNQEDWTYRALEASYHLLLIERKFEHDKRFLLFQPKFYFCTPFNIFLWDDNFVQLFCNIVSLWLHIPLDYNHFNRGRIA